MNVYLILPRNEGFLGALRAVRATSEHAARQALRQGGQCSFDYYLIPLPAGSKSAGGRLAGPELSEGESGAGPATDSARSEALPGAAPTVEREGYGELIELLRESLHPHYGPCDGMGKDGECWECLDNERHWLELKEQGPLKLGRHLADLHRRVRLAVRAHDEATAKGAAVEADAKAKDGEQ